MRYVCVLVFLWVNRERGCLLFLSRILSCLFIKILMNKKHRQRSIFFMICQFSHRISNLGFHNSCILDREISHGRRFKVPQWIFVLRPIGKLWPQISHYRFCIFETRHVDDQTLNDPLIHFNPKTSVPHRKH